MADTRLDEEGRLILPEEVRSALGWKAGEELHLQVAGDQLLVQRSSRSTSLKDEARRLADVMRGFTREATRQVADTLTGVTDKITSAPVGGGRTGPFHGVQPKLGERVYLAPGSQVIGDVVMGDDSSVWGSVVVRGDVAPVRIGARTNVQEGAVVHVSPQQPCHIGNRVTVGHQATVHACVVGDDTLIGIQAVVLDGARVGRHCIIAAGTVVPPGMEIPDGKMVMGVPAKIVRDLTAQEIERVHWNADSYVSLKGQYLNPSEGDEVRIPEAQPRPAPPERGSLPRYECRRVSEPIVVDGSLDEPAWSATRPLSALVQANGQGPSQEMTEVKACWDNRNLYVSFSCRDTDIWSDFENRDDPLYEQEVVEVFLCPTGDLRHYFEFEVSPRNVVFDARVFNPEGDRRSMLVDKEWNAARFLTGVGVSGTLDDRSSRDIGWIVEMAIPFADLGLSGPPEPGTVWRANFYRIERGAVEEFTAWAPTYEEPADFHVPSCFGELVFTLE